MGEESNSRKKVLLIDDDAIHLSITELALKDKYDIQMVKSGKEALELLEKDHSVPDLIMLDILMPEMDGWAVFDKINDIAALKFTPIMFFTSVVDESTKEKAYAIGALDYITKPCEPSYLRSRVEEDLRKAELKKQQYGI